jgi:transposase
LIPRLLRQLPCQRVDRFRSAVHRIFETIEEMRQALLGFRDNYKAIHQVTRHGTFARKSLDSQPFFPPTWTNRGGSPGTGRAYLGLLPRGATMETFVGLDVSLKDTSVCILNQKGALVFEGKVASEPTAIARLIRKHAPNLVRVGLESGPTSVWLTHTLLAEGLPLICLDARHAQAVLSVRPNKSDRGDARGLAEMVRVGWFKAVQVKSLTAHKTKALLIARQHLVEMRVRIDNQLRGILKTFGLVIGKCGHGQIGQRARELAEGHPGIDCIVASMVSVRDSLLKQIAVFDRSIRQLAKTDNTARRLMTVPGVGPVVALAYMAVIDNPERFDHARDVGTYLGLTPQRYQSGEVDLTGRISKCGDAFVRTCLYEAAGVLLTRVKRWSPLKAWGVRLMQRVGAKKAKVAVARKLAVILHCIWTDGTDFRWTKEALMA